MTAAPLQEETAPKRRGRPPKIRPPEESPGLEEAAPISEATWKEFHEFLLDRTEEFVKERNIKRWRILQTGAERFSQTLGHYWIRRLKG